LKDGKVVMLLEITEAQYAFLKQMGHDMNCYVIVADSQARRAPDCQCRNCQVCSRTAQLGVAPGTTSEPWARTEG
jgi:hypothetical protein